MKTTSLMLSAVLGLGAVTGAHAADAAAGKSVFNKCAICHSPAAGKNGVGPSLFGVVGRHAASVAGYHYSDALQAANLTWDEKTLDAWVTNPKKLVAGTKMSFPGLPKEDDRENLIAYLKTLK